MSNLCNVILLVVPRILFDDWTGEDYQNLITKKKEMAAMANVFIKAAEKYKFGGYVLEVWSQIASAIPFDTLVNLIKNIGKTIAFSTYYLITTSYFIFQQMP